MDNMFIRPAVLVIFAVVLLCTAALVSAQNEVPEVIPMDNPDYETHEKGIVRFKHRAHIDEFSARYPELFKNDCGTCHHDDEGLPLTDLQAGDPVDGCIDCHYEPGEMPSSVKREMRRQNASRQEIKDREIDYHAEAVHDLCRGCHRTVRKKSGTKAAPTTCTGCHPREK